MAAAFSIGHRHGPKIRSNRSPNHASKISTSASVTGTRSGQSSVTVQFARSCLGGRPTRRVGDCEIVEQIVGRRRTHDVYGDDSWHCERVIETCRHDRAAFHQREQSDSTLRSLRDFGGAVADAAIVGCINVAPARITRRLSMASPVRSACVRGASASPPKDRCAAAR